MRRLTLGASLSSLMLGGWAATAAGAPAQSVTTYVGAVRGTDALIALVVTRTEAVGYVCDSASIATHLAGDRDGAAYDLASPQTHRYSYGRSAPAAATTFRHNGRWASGKVTIAGRTHRFVATGAPAPAGYYRAQTDDLAAHWVVAADGEQRGAVIDRLTSGVISLGPVQLEVTTTLKLTLGGEPTRASRVGAP
jgi:hypothetical protein